MERWETGQNWWHERGHSLGCWLGSSLHPCPVWMEERAWESLLHTQSWAGPASARDAESKTSHSPSQNLLGSPWTSSYLPEMYLGVGHIQSRHRPPVLGLCPPAPRPAGTKPGHPGLCPPHRSPRIKGCADLEPQLRSGAGPCSLGVCSEPSGSVQGQRCACDTPGLPGAASAPSGPGV